MRTAFHTNGLKAMLGACGYSNVLSLYTIQLAPRGTKYGSHTVISAEGCIGLFCQISKGRVIPLFLPVFQSTDLAEVFLPICRLLLPLHLLTGGNLARSTMLPLP